MVPVNKCCSLYRFHLLSDFDEGKRSCRRKLERHNKRRRRRNTDGVSMMGKEKDPHGSLQMNVSCVDKSVTGMNWWNLNLFFIHVVSR